MAYTVTERGLVLIACGISAFITPLLSTMMNLSLVSIGEEFGVGSFGYEGNLLAVESQIAVFSGIASAKDVAADDSRRCDLLLRPSSRHPCRSVRPNSARPRHRDARPEAHHPLTVAHREQ